MTAGTSTGSILAAGLVYPRADNKNISFNGEVYREPGFFS